jgi:hypothetical protein
MGRQGVERTYATYGAALMVFTVTKGLARQWSPIQTGGFCLLPPPPSSSFIYCEARHENYSISIPVWPKYLLYLCSQPMCSPQF